MTNMGKENIIRKIESSELLNNFEGAKEYIISLIRKDIEYSSDMKCYRVLYQPDNTGFMIWADSEKEALNKARKRNRSELDNIEEENAKDYLINEFTQKTNDNGIMAFYDVYAVFERSGVVFCIDMSEKME